MKFANLSHKAICLSLFLGLFSVLTCSCQQPASSRQTQQLQPQIETTEREAPSITEAALSPDLSGITINNFMQVEAGVYRGSRPTPEQIQELARIGVRTVIDLQGGDAEMPVAGWIMGEIEPGEFTKDIEAEGREVLAAGISNFYNEALNSFESVNQPEAVKIQAALQIMSDPSKLPVYVHCEHGKDRTGLVVALYRVIYDHWSPEQAHQEMIQMGHSGELDHLFTGELDEYFYKVTGWSPSASLAQN